MRKLAIAAALLVAPATYAQTAPAADDAMVIYDKALGDGWQNWSWAKTELSSESGGSRLPVRVEAEGWQALFLHHDPFDTTPYRGISLLVQPTGGSGTVRVVATVDGKPILQPGSTEVPLGHDIAIAPGGWKQVVIPLKDIGADKKTIDGFWIQNATGEPAPTFFVAEVKLVK